MEEQFILRVPPAVAERIERLLNESASSSEDKSLDLSFSEDGRTGTFMIGNDRFSASLLDLPTVVESYKTYDNNVLIKTADIGQPEVVHRVEKDLQNIMAGGTAENICVEMAEQEEYGDETVGNASKKVVSTPSAKPAVPDTGTVGGEPDGSDSDESDDSI